MAYLDGNGLGYFWNKIKNFVSSKIVNSMSSNEPTTTAPSITAIKNYVDTKGSAYDQNVTLSTQTNTTTTTKPFGNTVTITTTGKPLVVMATATGKISGGNLNISLYMDGSIKQANLMTCDNTNRERMVGFKVFTDIAAGQHILQLGFACSQSNRTATIMPYCNHSILAFDI